MKYAKLDSSLESDYIDRLAEYAGKLISECGIANARNEYHKNRFNTPAYAFFEWDWQRAQEEVGIQLDRSAVLPFRPEWKDCMESDWTEFVHRAWRHAA